MTVSTARASMWGYRYFDSFNITPAYPFGFGGSYTTFALEVKDVALDGETVCIRVNVQNTGSRYAGRETVQVYLSQPQGKLDKPYQVLAGFAQDRFPGPRPVRDGDRHLPAAHPGLLRRGTGCLAAGKGRLLSACGQPFPQHLHCRRPGTGRDGGHRPAAEPAAAGLPPWRRCAQTRPASAPTRRKLGRKPLPPA